MSLTTILVLAAAIFVLGATPGPAVFAGVAHTLATGLSSGLLFALGVVVGDIILLLLAAFGMAAVAQSMGGVFALVKVAGGAYLVWLGIKAWRARPVPAGAAPAAGESAWRTSLGGLTLTLGNPKAILFYAALLPSFVDPTSLKAADLMLLVALVAAVLSSVMLGYCGLAARARGFFRSATAMRGLNRIAGTVLIGTGVAIATR